MNPSFNIKLPGVPVGKYDLFLEVSRHGVSYITTQDGRDCTGLACYDFPSGASDDAIADYLKEITSSEIFFNHNFESVNIFHAFPESILIPEEFAHATAGKDMLELVYGDVTEGVIHTDPMRSYHLQNLYRVPRQIESVLSSLFPDALHTHQHTLLPRLLKTNQDELFCIFGKGHLTAMLLKEGKLQLIQNYSYRIPEDIAYYLLNLCERFDVPSNTINLHLCGMIDSTSNLYRELYKYFLQMEFVSLPTSFRYPEEIDDFPPHFFSHLFALAACV